MNSQKIELTLKSASQISIIITDWVGYKLVEKRAIFAHMLKLVIICQ